jgi:hypothetical protein
MAFDPSVSQDASQANALKQFNEFAASEKAGPLANDSNTGMSDLRAQTKSWARFELPGNPSTFTPLCSAWHCNGVLVLPMQQHNTLPVQN